MEAGRDSRFGAGVQVSGDVGGIEIGVAAAVRCVGVRLLQPGGPRPEGTVDEEVACQPARTCRLYKGRGLFGVGDRFAPVPDDFHAVAGGAQLLPVVQTADVRARTFVDGDDPVGRRQVEGGEPGAGTLLRGQPVAGGGPNQVVGDGGQRALRIEALRSLQALRAPPQRGGRRRRMDVHAGQVGRPVADHTVQVVGARRRGFRPARLVPAVSPDRAVGMGLRVFADQLQAVSRRGGRAQIEAGERETGAGEVHMAVDEGRRDEGTVEVDDLGVGELGQADVVAAQPGDGAIADGHRGGVRHGRTVDPAGTKQRRQATRDEVEGAAALHRRHR